MFMYHGYYGFHGLWLIGAIIAIIPFWRICDRVGLSPWLSLLLLVPLANIFFVYYVASPTGRPSAAAPAARPPASAPARARRRPESQAATPPG